MGDIKRVPFQPRSHTRGVSVSVDKLRTPTAGDCTAIAPSTILARMSTSEEQIIKDMQIVYKQAIELGQHLELAICGVIQKLIYEMKHDEDFLIISLVIKIQIEQSYDIDELEANPTNQEPIKPRELAVQPAESTTQEDSANQPTEAIPAAQPEEKTTEKDIAVQPEETTTKEDLANQAEGVDTTDDLADQSVEKITIEDSADMPKADVTNEDSADQPEAKTTNKDSANQPEEQDDLANQPDEKPIKKNSPSSSPASKKKSRTFSKAKTVDSDGNSVHENEGSTSKVVEKPIPIPKANRGRKPKVKDISEQELTKKPNGKKAAVPVNKDEERIKKLKGFVVACGV
ncbi:hypothetical protein Pst134EB_004096 [Puccinia striiformis f. sp. tritici]|nr:hypothetical protein Pst134EB_004096 [Puccinia striiformis f. sp. tritici]